MFALKLRNNHDLVQIFNFIILIPTNRVSAWLIVYAFVQCICRLDGVLMCMFALAESANLRSVCIFCDHDK